MSFVIEAVTRATLPMLEDGLRALAHDLGDPYRLETAALENAVFSDVPSCCGAVVFDGTELTGVALYSPLMSTGIGSAGVYVSDLWIAPAARGAGLGRLLLGWVAARALSHWGSGFMCLAAYDDNPRSIDFYDRLGFARTDGTTTLRLSGAGYAALMRTK